MAKTFQQKKHQRVSKKGKFFTAGKKQFVREASAAAAGVVGAYLVRRYAGKAAEALLTKVEHRVTVAAGNALRTTVGRRRAFASRLLHNRPGLAKALGVKGVAAIKGKEAKVIKQLRLKFPKS